MEKRDKNAETPPAALFEESAEDLYEHAPCGYLSTLPGGTIVKVNQTFLTWTGFLREDLVGRKRFQELLSPGGRIYHETHYAPLLQMQGTVREIAVDVVCANGRRLPALINSVLQHDATGKPTLIRTTIFNATDRKEYERELLRERQRAEKAAQAKADFIAMVSHEIRTPLNAITGVAHLLGTTELSTQQQKLVRILRSSSGNLLNLINNILDFSKIEAGRTAPEERSLDLRQLVEGLVDSFQGKADEKGLILAVDVDERIPKELLGDPIKIGQVLTNLLGNALKFTAKGSVTLALQAQEIATDAVTIEFRVADSGIGIAPDRLPHVFDEFTQASYDVSMKYGGTGLGLAISKKLVELHGSRLAVESELDRGTTFSFSLRLKIAVAAGEVSSAAGEPIESSPLRGLKALLADDNDINIFVLSGFLHSWGIEIDVVKDGRQAVDHVRDNPYDLVLMDLRMPELDGDSATREIRALPGERFARLPIFAISASIRIGQQHELEAAGFTDFVGKPIDPDILFAKIAWHTGRTR